jgi:hypothetical protein
MGRTHNNPFPLAKRMRDVEAKDPTAKHPDSPAKDFIYTPMGTALNMELVRKMEEGPRHKPPKVINVGQVGYTLVIDAYTFGVKFFVKHDRKADTLALFVDEGDGPTKITEWSR